jgi:hypothetical protein
MPANIGGLDTPDEIPGRDINPLAGRTFPPRHRPDKKEDSRVPAPRARKTKAGRPE